MPTIVRGGSWKIAMYPGDHNPPHFHEIHRSGRRAIVEIASFVARGEVPAPAMREALVWAGKNRALLMQTWTKLQRVRG